MNLYEFLYGLNPRLVWPGLLVIVLAILAAAVVKALGPRANPAHLRLLTHACLGVIFAAVALQLVIAGGYLFYPSYLDHAESHVAAVSWLGWRGGPLYPSLDGGDIYGVPYGPNLYEVYGFLLALLGPSMVASKLIGLGIFAVAQLLSFIVLRRAGASASEALAITAVQCFVEAAFTDQAYVFGVRGDVLLFLVAQAAVLAATWGTGITNAILLGLLGAFAMNLKIHAALYILPSFAFYIGQLDTNAARLKALLVSVGAGLIFLVLPFLLANVSLREYWTYFNILARPPLLRWLFEQNIVFAVMFFVPLLWVYVSFAPKLPKGSAWFAGAMLPAMLLVAIAASVEGAGPHHLLPFMPSMAWAFVALRRAAARERDDRRDGAAQSALSAGLVFALLFGFGPLVVISWHRTLNAYADAPLARAATAEIERALADNPDLRVAVGPGGTADFDLSRLRVIPVFRGNPLPLDGTAWMNFQYEGISENIVKRVFRECRIDLWLMPRGRPLVATSVYGEQKPLFSDALRASFLENYELAGSGPIFDRWRCRHGR